MKRFVIGIAAVLFSLGAWALPVNINTASAQEMADGLKGVGLKRAEAIIAKRVELGGFKSKQELMLVKGIGAKMFERIEKDVTLTSE